PVLLGGYPGGFTGTPGGLWVVGGGRLPGGTRVVDLVALDGGHRGHAGDGIAVGIAGSAVLAGNRAGTAAPLSRGGHGTKKRDEARYAVAFASWGAVWPLLICPRWQECRRR